MTNPQHTRRFPRVGISFDVEVWLDRLGLQRSVSGRFVMLGAGGTFLEVTENYPTGTFLKIRFDPGELGEISCDAIVRNTLEGKGVGLEFLDLAPHDQKRIEEFVENARKLATSP